MKFISILEVSFIQRILIDENILWLNPIPREYNMASLSEKEFDVWGLLTPIAFSGMILAGLDIFIKKLYLEWIL